MPAVVYRRLAPPFELVAASWSGQLYSVPHDPGDTTGRQSPDGKWVIGTNAVYDLVSGGSTPLPGGPDTTPTWSGDSDRICMVSPTGGDGSPEAISIAPVGGPAKELARVGAVHPQAGVTILACSALSNRVVVAQLGVAGETTELWVLDATTGAMEHHSTYRPATKSGSVAGTLVVVSADGRYLAETDAATVITSIRRVDDGALVFQMDGLQVFAFSADDSAVLVLPRQADLPVDNSVFDNPSVLSLQNGQSVWQAPPQTLFAGSIIGQPGGGGLAILLTICGDLPRGCQQNLWLIGSDGKARELDHDVQALF